MVKTNLVVESCLKGKVFLPFPNGFSKHWGEKVVATERTRHEEHTVGRHCWCLYSAIYMKRDRASCVENENENEVQILHTFSTQHTWQVAVCQFKIRKSPKLSLNAVVRKGWGDRVSSTDRRSDMQLIGSMQ